MNRGTNSVVVEIAPDSTVRVIEQAVRKNHPLKLEFSNHRDLDDLAGRFTEARRDALIVTVEDIRPDAAWRSACCEGSFSLGGVEYLFSSSVLDFSEPDRGAKIEIVRPETLHTWQRRRFMRATVADSSYVTLCAPGDFRQPLFEGKMLNVSEDGLACRVERASVDRYAIGERLGAQFALGATARPHRLNAVIKSKTPGGTEGTIILGIQFDTSAGADEERAGLAEALRMFV
jgi:hypothetical protein